MPTKTKKPDTETVADRLMTEDLADVLKRAEGGDTVAAHRVIPILTSILWTGRQQKNAALLSPPRPVPDYVRDYLAKALSKIATGSDANQALGLVTKRAPNKNDHFHLRRAAYVMHQLLNPSFANGRPVPPIKTRKEAAKLAAEGFNKVEKELAKEWPGSKPVTVTATAVANWYRSNESDLLKIIGVKRNKL